MLDYLLENKEWIFSGIGIFLLAGTGAVLKYILPKIKGKKENANVSVSEMTKKISSGLNKRIESAHSTQSENIVDITVKEIIDEIQNMPPFQQASAGKNYNGIKVQWEGRLWNVEKSHRSNKNIVRVDIKPHPNDLHYTIFLYVDIEKFPELKVAKRDYTIKVKGKIIDCSSAGMYVELEPEYLSVLKNIEN